MVAAKNGGRKKGEYEFRGGEALFEGGDGGVWTAHDDGCKVG